MYPIPKDLPPHLWKEWERASEKAEANTEIASLRSQLAASQARVERLEVAIRDAKGLVEGDENDLTMAYNVLDEALNAESEASDGP